jgi:hypothetical protein
MQGMEHLESLGVVVNVDVVINALNVRELPGIVGTFLERGIREFDLLWLVPFGRAWENRAELVCDPASAMPPLHEALRLAMEAGATVWTNRLPPALLEGFENLIQDPHKLHDEVRGRAVEFRALLSEGAPMVCREPERCALCFLEGFCDWLEEAPGEPGSRRVSGDPAELDGLLGAGGEVEVVLNRETAKWIRENVERVREALPRLAFSLQTFLTASETQAAGVDPAKALEPLAGLPVRLINLPRCLTEGVVERRQQEIDRAGLAAITEAFILDGYRVYSMRCTDCARREGCPGMPINHVRVFGFGMLTPSPA